jgi:hypothetical protein
LFLVMTTVSGGAALGYKEPPCEMLGEPVFAVNNGPFTPWFLRRNEIMVEIPAKPIDFQNPESSAKGTLSFSTPD